MRLNYENTKIGQTVKVQQFYGRITNNFYTGTITNRDGQNIVVEVTTREVNEPIVDGDTIKIREYEACNPEYAIVKEI